MAFNAQPNFNGVLDGTNVVELNQKLDYSKIHLNERKEIVENIIENTEFYQEYFSDYFRADIRSGDQLSTNINVCKSLERMANYLLNSKEIKEEEDSEKTKYIFHTDERYFRKKVERESSIEQIIGSESSDYENNVIHFLKREEQNFKKEKIQTIDHENISPSKLNSIFDVENVKSVLKDYRVFYDLVTNRLLDPNEKTNRYILTKVKGQLTDDMTYTKDAMLGIFGYDLRNWEKETTVPDMNRFDFTNERHIKGGPVTFVGKGNKKTTIIAKGLMYFTPSGDFNNDFNLVLLDFENTVKKANLTEDEYQILQMSRNGLTQMEISEFFDTYPMRISRVLDRISRKIMAVGNKYDLAEVTN